MEQVARPAMVVCLCCRGWVGVRPQGFFFQVSSALAQGWRKQVGVSHQKRAPVPGRFPWFLVQFFRRSHLLRNTSCARQKMPGQQIRSEVHPGPGVEPTRRPGCVAIPVSVWGAPGDRLTPWGLPFCHIWQTGRPLGSLSTGAPELCPQFCPHSWGQN